MQRHRSTRSVIALAVLASACAAGTQTGAFTPRGASARGPWALTGLMVCLGALVYLLVGAAVLIALRRSPRAGADAHRFDRRVIVAGGLLLPAPILLTLLVANIAVIASQARQGQLRVEITGYQYWREVRYPAQGIVTANEVHIPTGENVEFVLRSADVIHSWWVPELAGKRDLIPSKANVLVVQADAPGTYRGQCAEFCGIQHASMGMVVIAHEPAEFRAWARNEAAPASSPATASLRRGQETFLQNCAGCHTVRGTPADGEKGPSLTHFAARRRIGGGQPHAADPRAPRAAVAASSWALGARSGGSSVNGPAASTASTGPPARRPG